MDPVGKTNCCNGAALLGKGAALGTALAFGILIVGYLFNLVM